MIYPQLDIRRYDEQMSSALANMVSGRFDFMGLPHLARVYRLRALELFYKAVMELGDFEHTSDWDWRITIMHGPGNEMGQYNGTVYSDSDSVADRWCDNIFMAYTVEPTDYVDGFARWQYLSVEEIDENGDPTLMKVLIDHIRIIEIGEA